MDKEIEITKWSFDYLPTNLEAQILVLNPYISSLERDILFWWERGGCHVRAKREENKNKEKGEENEGWTFCLMQPRKWDKDRTFGAAKIR